MVKQQILKVSELNLQTKQCLESQFGDVWVEGEISNLATPVSGHLYFSLKDKDAQIRCALFKGIASKLNLTLKNGLQVVVRAKVSLYAPRGDYQLIINHAEAAGEGALRIAFEQLKNKLQKEGLFDQKHKKPLPKHCQRLGVITSATGAAIKDILSVLQRRFPQLPIVVYPTSVQGKLATSEICHAIEIANLHQYCDVLILSRGGGSLEDLWPFNEESVARAIFASHLPIVSGVGHEIDFTIADFVADLRAPTPSSAAELVSPNRDEMIQLFSYLYQQLINAMTKLLRESNFALTLLQKRLKHPGQLLNEYAQRLDYTENQLIYAINLFLQKYQTQLIQLAEQINPLHITYRINQYENKINYYQQNLKRLILLKLTQLNQQIHHKTTLLNTLNPLNTLERGFAIVRDQHDHVVTKHTEVNQGENIMVTLKQGELQCVVVDNKSKSDS